MFFCCCTNCTIATDNFDRADSSTVGDGWTEVAGDWALVSGQLDPPSNGVITFNPTGNPGDMIRWAGWVTFGGANGTARFIVDYVDANNYHYAEVNATGATTGNVRLWRRSGGSNTAIGTQITITGFSHTVSQSVAVCWGDDILKVTAGPNNSASTAATTGHGGTAVGLATTTTGASMRFVGPFSLGHLTDSCPDCPASGTCNQCVDNDAPRFLKLVVTGIADDGCSVCDEINGTLIASGVSSSIEQTECDGTGANASACSWTTGALGINALACTCWGAASITIKLYEVDDVFYLTAILSHTLSAGCDESGDGARWHAELTGVTAPVDCYSALDGVVLPLQCEYHPDDPLLTCTYTGSTITVSLP